MSTSARAVRSPKTSTKPVVTVTVHPIETVSEPAQTSPNEDEIAVRAYEIWQREGEEHGNHDRHWFQAIEELTAEANGTGSGGGSPVE